MGDSKIRIMPDCHQGKGCVIGFTATLNDRVVPNLVGVDIGCGISVVKLGKISDVNLSLIDDIIRDYIPAGFNVHNKPIIEFSILSELYCYTSLSNIERIKCSIGTLGGGNHFIELGKDSENNLYLIIHTGSRNLGFQVANYYQNMAIELNNNKNKDSYNTEIDKVIREYKSKGKVKKIELALKALWNKYKNIETEIPEELCYLGEEWKHLYFHDMQICQYFATLNRITIANIILDELYGTDIDDYEFFETIHNYIDLKNKIIRKGAISAYEGEKLLVPINMRDGSILCKGKGNPDWNYSAPHGAGRIMSRRKAQETLSLADYKNEMKNIYTTSVNKYTLDEAPMSYKPMKEIVDNIHDTVEVLDIIKPIYNFKDSSGSNNMKGGHNNI